MPNWFAAPFTGCVDLNSVRYVAHENGVTSHLFSRGVQYQVLNAYIKDGRYFLEIEVIPNV